MQGHYWNCQTCQLENKHFPPSNHPFHLKTLKVNILSLQLLFQPIPSEYPLHLRHLHAGPEAAEGYPEVDKTGQKNGTSWWLKSVSPVEVGSFYPITYKGILYISGGCLGFLPPIVSPVEPNEKKKTGSILPNRDPEHVFFCGIISYNWVVCHSLYTLNNQAFFHCLAENGKGLAKMHLETVFKEG